jgi:hypothetical protein
MSSKSRETVALDEATAPVVVNLGADLSPAIRAIENAYRQIQKRYPGTPDAVIVVKRDDKAWGHTTVAKTWAHVDHTDASHFEIMISGENLRRGAVQVAATLLHEAAHARNLAAGVLDTDTNGRHNAAFKARAEDHGLVVERSGWHGWTGTSLDAAGEALHKRLIATIAAGIAKSAAAGIEADLSHLGIAPTPAGVGPDGEPVATGGTRAVAPPKRGNRNLLVAQCGCGHKIRVSRGVLDVARPTCGVCSEEFTAS